MFPARAAARRLAWLTVCVFAAALPSSRTPAEDKPPMTGPLPNEVRPRDDRWGKPANGWQRQIVLLRDRIAATERSLPAIVWFKNATGQRQVLTSIVPAWSPHGDIELVGPDGTNVLIFECLKKHVTVDIPFEAGAVRGFWCDVLRQPCTKLDEARFKPGRYTVRLAGGSNEVKVEVE